MGDHDQDARDAANTLMAAEMLLDEVKEEGRCRWGTSSLKPVASRFLERGFSVVARGEGKRQVRPLSAPL